jgi:hypothetical protein
MYYFARIELSEKQNNAEYAKQYRLKRKLLTATSSFHIVRNGNTAKTKEGRRKYCKNKRRQMEILQKQKKAEYAKKSKIVPCICAAVRHIHVKRRASLRGAWFLFLYTIISICTINKT